MSNMKQVCLKRRPEKNSQNHNLILLKAQFADIDTAHALKWSIYLAFVLKTCIYSFIYYNATTFS